METLRYRLLNNWNLMRVIRLVMGLIIGAQALPTVACRWPCWQRFYSIRFRYRMLCRRQLQHAASQLNKF
jgi:hypothetical protein